MLACANRGFKNGEENLLRLIWNVNFFSSQVKNKKCEPNLIIDVHTKMNILSVPSIINGDI